MFDKIVPANKHHQHPATAGISEAAIAQQVVEMIIPSITKIIEKAMASASFLATPTIVSDNMPKQSSESINLPASPITKKSSQTSLSNQPNPICESRPVAINSSDNALVSSSPPISHSQTQSCLQPLTIMALDKIRDLLGDPTANWTCPAQREAMLAVLERKTDVMALMNTSSGKTMLVMVPTLLEDTITAYLVPLKSLMLDVCRNLEDMGVEFEVFTGTSTRISGTKKLVLVSADRARLPQWREALAEVNLRVTVGRLVFDEAHLGLTANDYREALQHLYDLRQFPNMQLVALTATVQPVSEATLMDAFGLAPDTIIIRTPSIRPELQYILEAPRANSNLIATRVKDILAQNQLLPKERALIFVPFLDQGEDLAELLQCEFYNGGKDTTDEQRLNIYNQWISGAHQVMICTSAFSAGNNYPSVRLVIHAGTPREMIGCIQEMSRGGRDHQPTKCYLLPKQAGPPPVPSLFDDKIDHKGLLAVYNWIFPSKKTCLRFGLTAFIDGVGISCLEDNTFQKCNICKPLPPLHHTASLGTSTGSQPSSSSLKRPAALISSSPPTSSTELAFHTSKRRKTDRQMDQLHYVDRMKAALDYFRGTCAHCKVHGINDVSHSIMVCPGLAQKNINSYLSWRKTIQYSNFHGKICYRCHVPQCDGKLHPTFTKGGYTCQFPDILAPMAYGIYNLDHLNSKAALHFKKQWNSLEEFVSWINDRPAVGEQSNITALALWYHKLITS